MDFPTIDGRLQHDAWLALRSTRVDPGEASCAQNPFDAESLSKYVHRQLKINSKISKNTQTIDDSIDEFELDEEENDDDITVNEVEDNQQASEFHDEIIDDDEDEDEKVQKSAFFPLDRTHRSINPYQLKSSTDDQYSNSYLISTLRSLLSFTSFYSSPVTYFFFAHVNSSYWIDRLYTTKTNIDRHTCPLQQPQMHHQQQSNNQQIILSIHIFDLQTATPSILH
ncbi:unnamed protein product [Rotaria sordida]|uniref:Uncharacterized protein n=1 Tax=Rotaria sordida TaxID=392033 RepID=A0A819U010_9BILA|nr:unnamed protein product [Rotaria sordida]CAF1079002.1 unnamed protein product [Rotaria sordida]CAF1177631.1 unnamed protein product [Rotaria sordida]CAF4071768.1 unnamed protein product [Rotaria sordida]CAF4087857.1 unnamed protein product [Rotaria sordida]